MKKYVTPALFIIATAALLAGAAAAQEEAGEPTAEEAGKTLKVVTTVGGEEAGDEDLPPLEPDKQVRKIQAIVPVLGVLVPITLFAAIAVVLIVAILMAHKAAVKRYEVLEVAIKEGRELPPDIFRNGHRRRRDPLLSGLVLTALGVALAIALGAVAGWVQAVWGLIPLFIGLAFLVYVPFYRKQRKEDENR
jgi:hypothetical protein